jgi:hypothetical protein
MSVLPLTLYPLPVKDGERGSRTLALVPFSPLSREEGAGRRMRGRADEEHLNCLKLE